MPGKPIKLIVGLGNPGSEYEKTPHNAGFWLIDEILHRYNGHLKPESRFHGAAGKLYIDGCECWLLKPATFMNESGIAVAALANYFRIDQSEIIVAHDELDFEPGIARIKRGGGHGGHNGLRDIISIIGNDFYRLRIGVGHPGDRNKVTGYLLGKASKELIDGVMHSISNIMNILEPMTTGSIDRAILQLHTEK